MTNRPNDVELVEVTIKSSSGREIIINNKNLIGRLLLSITRNVMRYSLKNLPNDDPGIWVKSLADHEIPFIGVVGIMKREIALRLATRFRIIEWSDDRKYIRLTAFGIKLYYIGLHSTSEH